MTQNPFLIFFVCAIILAIVHVWMMRAKAQGQIKPDKLSAGERIVTLIIGIVGGILPPGIVYYVGLKKLFPNKAWQIVKMFMLALGVTLILLVSLAAFSIYRLQQSRQEAGKQLDHIKNLQSQMEAEQRKNDAL